LQYGGFPYNNYMTRIPNDQISYLSVKIEFLIAYGDIHHGVP